MVSMSSNCALPLDDASGWTCGSGVSIDTEAKEIVFADIERPSAAVMGGSCCEIGKRYFVTGECTAISDGDDYMIPSVGGVSLPAVQNLGPFSGVIVATSDILPPRITAIGGWRSTNARIANFGVFEIVPD